MTTKAITQTTDPIPAEVRAALTTIIMWGIDTAARKIKER